MKVSIAMVTYNHEQFIAKALDSILMQRTNFDYEIVIGEDCSTDNTRRIVVAYKKRYPDKIRVFFNKNNLGMHGNGAQVLQACKGDYIAMLDGDDYWISPDKLQKQVDFLDTHSECSSCYHDAMIINEENGEVPIHYRPHQKEFSTVEDLLLDNFIPTAAVMFRSEVLGTVPSWAEKLKMGDWVIHILNALHGKVGYIDETMSVYVVHRGGVWSTKTWQNHTRAIIGLFEALDKHLEPKYRRNTRRILRWRYFDASEKYEQSGDVACARDFAVKAFMKHVLIIIENFISFKNTELVSIPHYMLSVRGVVLLKNVLRMYVVLPMRTHFPPPLYKSIGTLARKLDLGF